MVYFEGYSSLISAEERSEQPIARYESVSCVIHVTITTIPWEENYRQFLKSIDNRIVPRGSLYRTSARPEVFAARGSPPSLRPVLCANRDQWR